MAKSSLENTKNTNKKLRRSNKSRSDGAAENEKRPEQKQETLPIAPDPNSIKNQILIFVYYVLAFYLVLCFTFTDMSLASSAKTGIVGYYTCALLYGLFGSGAFVVPAALVFLAIFWKKFVARSAVRSRLVISTLLVITLSAFIHICFMLSGNSIAFSALWKNGMAYKGGGLVGGLMGSLFYFCFRGIAPVITAVLVVALVMLLVEITPNLLGAWIIRFVKFIISKIKAKAEKKKEEKAKKEVIYYTSKPSQTDPDAYETDSAFGQDKKSGVDEDAGAKADEPFVADIPITGYGITNKKNTDTKAEETVFTPEKPKQPLSSYTANGENLKFDIDGNATSAGMEPFPAEELNDQGADELDRILYAGVKEPEPAIRVIDDDEELMGDELIDAIIDEEVNEPATNEDNGEATVTDELIMQQTELIFEPKPEPKIYKLPPLTLLYKKINTQNEDSNDELQRNAQMLVDTLHSFKVDTEIINISCGPTITRYELMPKTGVRVRAIANLVDDLSLRLESQGVRIEAPIPGKAAVGIEVPNKVRNDVYLRSLLEMPNFEQAKSKLTVGLGVDVAGNPIFFDISKMPHLLIAGATGMGKSVCINSIIVSLLYKANPDEVKLILIDPKKVELNIYNKLPHLLVPVVSQPKKAAGALNWAVSEMERRFELIEGVGARDIKGYNSFTKDDPTHEFLPSIVIIIDELADLMMTAPDDVEASICRLAQKARAAGMHLIIGTQRPSVDVITGLIKANIPSRIAFTVASNIDSRTIIDIAGAEKLTGRGDMLFAPVGAMKPMRVQGAFVSENEVIAVVNFIRTQTGETEYDGDIQSMIDREAENCGKKKDIAQIGSESAEGDFGDPKFIEAVELAFEAEKVSTSLLQRRLSLGYGRAAKIIDRMEELGIIGPPEGQKPRSLLISHSDFMEMVMRSSSGEQNK